MGSSAITSIRALHQQAKNKIMAAHHQPKPKQKPASSHSSLGRIGQQRAKAAEESLRTVMYFSNWGPYT
ncbi:unnamed protein product [Linum tenue]|uniref:Uncharacterized protein n=1 Tax=Linum tenue TaxID=586396 RepID=A0AAV0NR58_9ROSI|nr:unnamed protein product [Linum tenue]